MWRITCANPDCKEKTRAWKIVDLLQNNRDRDGWFLCWCGERGYLAKSFKLQEPGDVREPYLKRTIQLGDPHEYLPTLCFPGGTLARWSRGPGLVLLLQGPPTVRWPPQNGLRPAGTYHPPALTAGGPMNGVRSARLPPERLSPRRFAHESPQCRETSIPAPRSTSIRRGSRPCIWPRSTAHNTGPTVVEGRAGGI